MTASTAKPTRSTSPTEGRRPAAVNGHRAQSLPVSLLDRSGRGDADACGPAAQAHGPGLGGVGRGSPTALVRISCSRLRPRRAPIRHREVSDRCGSPRSARRSPGTGAYGAGRRRRGGCLGRDQRRADDDHGQRGQSSEEGTAEAAHVDWLGSPVRGAPRSNQSCRRLSTAGFSLEHARLPHGPARRPHRRRRARARRSSAPLERPRLSGAFP
jgi:hypothetical protein